MDISDLPFTQRMQAREGLLRGLYLSIACDIDRVLADVITKCEVKDPKERETFKWQKIIHLEMGKKISRCEKALGEYKTFYLQANEAHFKTIRAFLKLRNMFTHGYADFDEAQKDESFIVFDWFEAPKKRTMKVNVQAKMAELNQYRTMIMGFLLLPVILANEVGPE